MVRTDLERLVAPHNQSDLSALLVLQQSHISRSTLLPLLRLLVKSEELGTPRRKQKSSFSKAFRIAATAAAPAEPPALKGVC